MTRLAFLPLFLAAACAGEPNVDYDVQPVVNGSPEFGFPAVGQLQMPKGAGRMGACTGTLIDPTHVVSAAHCFVDLDQEDRLIHPQFVLGFDASSRSSEREVFKITGLYNFPSYMSPDKEHDFAVATLDRPATVTPMRLATNTPERGEAVFIGYGDQGNGSFGERYSTPESFTRVSDSEVEAISERLCFGDSGGPLISNGEVVAVLSRGPGRGSSGCGGPNRLARVDAHAPVAMTDIARLDGLHSNGTVAGAGTLHRASVGDFAHVDIPADATFAVATIIASDTVDLVAGDGFSECRSSGTIAQCALQTTESTSIEIDVQGQSDIVFYQVVADGTPPDLGDLDPDFSGFFGNGGGCSTGGGDAYWLALLGIALVFYRRRRTA